MRMLSLVVVTLLAATVTSQRLPLNVYTSSDGLASSVIHNLTRDSHGFLWISARGGLSRYDGNEFVTVRFTEEPSPFVHSLLETRDGRYFWIVTDNALYRVARADHPAAKPLVQGARVAEVNLAATKVSSRSFWRLFERSDGRIFAGADSGLYEMIDREGGTVEFRPVTFSAAAASARRTGVRDFFETDDSLWVAADIGIVRHLPDGRWITYEVPSVLTVGNEAHSIQSDSNGRIWATFRSGVFVLKPEPVDQIKDLASLGIRRPVLQTTYLDSSGSIDLPDEPGKMATLKFAEQERTDLGGQSGQARSSFVQDIFRSSDGKLWLPVEGGLYIVEDEAYYRTQDASGLLSGSLDINEDINGDIWMGTAVGLVKYSRSGLTSYAQTSGLVQPAINFIGETAGRLFVSHGQWQVSIQHQDRFVTKQLKLGPELRASWTSFAVVPDNAGGFWVLTTLGLFRLPARESIDATVGQHPSSNFGLDPTLRSKAFYRAFNDRQGRTWFSAQDLKSRKRILLRFDPEVNEWRDLSLAEGFPSNKTIASFAEDRAGNVWLGFYDGTGILKFTDDRFVEYGTDAGVPNGSILALYLDTKGRLWLGSNEGGLARVDDPTAELKFDSYSVDYGLSSNNVRSIVEGRDGRIYAGTVRGITRIDAEAGRLTHLGPDEGLAADFVHVSYGSRDGALWFGTSNGLSRLMPSNGIARPAPPVFITRLDIAGNPYALSGLGQQEVTGIQVGPSDNNLEVAFTAVGRNLRFEYKLEGSGEDEWRIAGVERSVHFANLAPASYRFLVRAVNADGSASEQPASVSVTIDPPFWRQSWFAALFLIFAAGSIFALDRYRVSNTRKVKRALALSQENETRFRTLAETASDAIITIDEDSNIIFVNEAVVHTFGYKPDEVIGKKLTMLMPERMVSGHENGVRRYIESGQKSMSWAGVSLPGRHKDGHDIPLEISFGEFKRDGRSYFTGIARDISERILAERALQKTREERFRELERVRSRIATDLHDDIGSSLTQITVLSEVARGAATSMQADQLVHPLERIKVVSKELVAVMSDVVWAINPQKDYLHDLVQRMRRFGSDIFSGRAISFEFAAPELDDNIQLGANVRREVFAIFKEAANNIVKYSSCSAVKCEFYIERSELFLTIRDDGVGFDAERVLSEKFRPEMGGNGLVSMRRRAVELGGTIAVLSAPGRGTAISLRIPLHPHENGTA